MLVWIILGIIVAVLVIAGIYVVSLYNTLIKRKNSVEEAFSTMDVYMKKRWDLIPNLVETVKGYAKHEKDTLKEVLELRVGNYDTMSSNQKLDANKKLSTGIAKLLAVAENYPTLQASENFKQLTSELSKVEEDIANSRKYYNGTVRVFNNKVQVFPNNIFVKMFGFSKMTMFEIEESEKQNVKVEF